MKKLERKTEVEEVEIKGFSKWESIKLKLFTLGTVAFMAPTQVHADNKPSSTVINRGLSLDQLLGGVLDAVMYLIQAVGALMAFYGVALVILSFNPNGSGDKRTDGAVYAIMGIMLFGFKYVIGMTGLLNF